MQVYFRKAGREMTKYKLLMVMLVLALLASCGGGGSSLQSGPQDDGGITVTPQVSAGGMTLGVLKDASGVPQGIRVTFQRVTDASVSGYWVYRGGTAADLPDGNPTGYSTYRANSTLIPQPGSGSTVVFDDTSFTPVIGEDYYYRVTVQNNSGDESDFSNQLGITIAAHTISSITTAAVGIGDQVTIAGTHFGTSRSGDKVFFTNASGSTTVEAGSYVSWTATQIVVTVPYGAADGVLGVQVGDSTVYSTQSIAYKEPAISGQPSPLEDWVQHNAVTLTGTDFGPAPGSGGSASTVYFGATAAQTSDVVTWTTTQIQVKVPAAATGMVVTVKVVVAGNNSNTVNFTILPHVDSLSAGSGQGGASITLSGTNFGTTQGSGNVTITGNAAGITSWSNSSVVITVPDNAVDGTLSLVRSDGKSSSGGGFDVIPAITGLNFARRAVGETLIISGKGFGSTRGTSTITFDGGSVSVATYNSWAYNSVSVVVPAGATRGTITITIDDNDTGGLTQDSATSSSQVTIVLPPPVIDDLGQL
jgi:hypothetical protein